MNTGILAERLHLQAAPADLVKAAEWVTNALLADIVEGRARPPTLVVLGRRCSRWELRDPSLALEDVVRSICRAESAYVAALAFPQPLPPEVQGADSGWLITCEDALNRLDVLVAMKGDTFRLFTTPPTPQMPRWIGQDPDRDVDLSAPLTMLGMEAQGSA